MFAVFQLFFTRSSVKIFGYGIIWFLIHERWLEFLPAGFQGCCGCGESMDPCAGLRWCQHSFKSAVAVVNPWMLVQVGVLASRVSGVLWLW